MNKTTVILIGAVALGAVVFAVYEYMQVSTYQAAFGPIPAGGFVAGTSVVVK